MKKNVALALLLCMLIAVLAPLGVCAVDTASDGKSIDIYLIAGQSNASGTSKVSDASAAYLWAPELRNGYSNICLQQFPDTGCHVTCSPCRYGAIAVQNLLGYPQHICLHFIHIADDAALIYQGCTGNGSQDGTDTAAGEAFRRNQGLTCKTADDLRWQTHHGKRP